MSISFAPGFTVPVIAQTNTDTATANLGSLAIGTSIFVVIHRADSAAIINSVQMTNESDLVITGSEIHSTNVDEKYVAYRLMGVTTNSGNKIVTVNLNGGVTGDVLVFPLLGCNTVDCFDTYASNDVNTSVSTAPVQITPNTSNAMIICMAASAFGGVPAAQSGYTTSGTLQNIFGYDGSEFNLDVGAIGSKDVRMTSGSPGSFFTLAYVLKSSGSGSSIKPFRMYSNGAFQANAFVQASLPTGVVLRLYGSNNVVHCANLIQSGTGKIKIQANGQLIVNNTIIV